MPGLEGNPFGKAGVALYLRYLAAGNDQDIEVARRRKHAIRQDFHSSARMDRPHGRRDQEAFEQGALAATAAVYTGRGGKDLKGSGKVEDFDLVENEYAYALHDTFLGVS